MNASPVRTRPRGQGGFTLLELLVVVGTLSVMSGAAVVGVGSMRANAQRAACDADADTISTAEEAALIQGSYLSEADLVAKGFLADESTRWDVTVSGASFQLVPIGDCVPDGAEEAAGTTPTTVDPLAKQKAEQAARDKAQADALAKQKAEQAARDKAKAEALAKQKAEQAARDKAKAEALAKQKAEQAARDRAKADALAKQKAEQAARDKAKAEALKKQKAEQAARDKAKAEALKKQKAEQAARDKAKAEALAKQKAGRG